MLSRHPVSAGHSLWPTNRVKEVQGDIQSLPCIPKTKSSLIRAHTLVHGGAFLDWLRGPECWSAGGRLPHRGTCLDRTRCRDNWVPLPNPQPQGKPLSGLHPSSGPRRRLDWVPSAKWLLGSGHAQAPRWTPGFWLANWPHPNLAFLASCLNFRLHFGIQQWESLDKFLQMI